MGFEENLTDLDWALNAGNWQWLSASRFFFQYFKVYSPVSFAKPKDKQGLYIRKWIPALKKMPDKYIYEPWTAPLNIQKEAGCIIGTHSPAPMVEHDIVNNENKG